MICSKVTVELIALFKPPVDPVQRDTAEYDETKASEQSSPADIPENNSNHT
jgi:hypothetical protein